MASQKPITGADVRETRLKSGLNQQQFWKKFGVTQSGGSRYEAGRSVPVPVQKLITIAFGTQRDADKLIAELRPAKSVTKKG